MQGIKEEGVADMKQMLQGNYAECEHDYKSVRSLIRFVIAEGMVEI